MTDTPDWAQGTDDSIHSFPGDTGGALPNPNILQNFLGNVIETILKRIVLTIVGVLLPGPAGAQLGNFFTTVFDNITAIFGMGSGALGGTVAPTSIWSNITSVFINPLGFFANLISGFIPGAQIPGLDATKITSGNFAQSIVTGLTGDINNALGWLAGFVNAFTGQGYTAGDVKAGNLTSSDAGVIAANAAESLLANSIAVLALQAQQDGSTNSGLASSDDFERTAATDINGAAGVGFWAKTSSATDAVGGYYAIADGHTASFVPGSGTGDQKIVFRRTKTADALTQTLYQKVGLVVGGFIGDPPFFSGASSIRLRSRLNAAETQEVFCTVTADGFAQFGYRNGAATDTMIGSPTNVGAPVPGTTWYLVAGTVGGLRQFQLLKNGGVVLTWNDGGSLSAAVLVTNCGWGWGGFCAASTGGGIKKPSDVGIVSVADNTPATVVGSIITVARTNATGVSLTGSTTLPASFWDNVEVISSDFTFNAITGEVTVNKTGPYGISYCLRDSASYGGSIWAEALVLVNGTVRKRNVGIQSGSGVTTFAPQDVELNTKIYLTSGDKVSFGMGRSGGAAALIGDAAGSMSYFSMTGLNN